MLIALTSSTTFGYCFMKSNPSAPLPMYDGIATLYNLVSLIAYPPTTTSCILGAFPKSYLYLTPDTNKNEPINECGRPFTAYSSIFITADPGTSFTITLSSIMLLILDNFIVPSGRMTSFRMHPEFSSAMSTS